MIAANQHLVSTLIALFLASTLYAIALEWLEKNWQFVTDYTWITVIVGVALTLLGLAVLNPDCAVLALVLFAVTGIPMVIRALIVDQRNRQELRDAIRDRDDE